MWGWIGATVLVGCAGRAPGPSVEDRGVRFLWTYADELNLTLDACTDDPELVAPFESLATELVGSSVAYEVDADGVAAIVLDCESIDLSGCAPRAPAFLLSIERHRLVGESIQQTEPLDPRCDLTAFAVLDITDQGDTAMIRTGLRYELQGACDDAREALVGDNGFGIDGCSGMVAGEADLDARE